MAITELDLSSNTFTLTPMNITDRTKVLLDSIISNIKNDKLKFEFAQTETQGKLNEVINAYNALTDGLTVDIDELQNKIGAIVALQSESQEDDTFVSMFTKLYDELNRRKETLSWTLDVTETTRGKVGIDLSAYGFNSPDEYEVLCGVRTKTGLNLSATFEKVDANGGIVTIRDNDFVSFAENDGSYFTADATTNKIQLTVFLSKTATPLFAKVTEVDGDVDEFGTPLVPPVDKTSLVIDTADGGKLKFEGTQGTDADTVLTIVGSDGSLSFNTAGIISGTDVFTFNSNEAAKLNGSITIQKKVGTVNAPSRTFNYVSPYPQVALSFLTVNDVQDLVWDSNTTIPDGTLTCIIFPADSDATTVTGTISNGVVTITPSQTVKSKLADGAPHDIEFYVTSTAGLESVHKTLSYTKQVSANNNEV